MQIFDLFGIRSNRQTSNIYFLIFYPAHMLIWQLFHTDFYIIFAL